MMYKKRGMIMKKIIVVLLVLCLLLPCLAACEDDSYSYGGGGYYDDDGGGNGSGYDDDDDNWWDDWDDGNKNNNGAASLGDGPFTEELIYEIYSIMNSHSFEKYRSVIDGEETWNSYSDAEKTALFETFSSMAKELGLSFSNSESQWRENMDEDCGYYSLWAGAFISLSINGDVQSRLSNFSSIFNYVRGLEDGKYSPLHPEILAAADSLTVEYYIGSYLLCVGGIHNISQITYKAMTHEEGIYYESGGITAVDGADIFSDDHLSYYISGGNGVIESVSFGETEFVPVLRAVGAIDGDGLMLNDQIQISAISEFNAPVLYVHTQDGNGLITVAAVRYNQNAGAYEWDGEMFNTSERTCFTKDGVFCYIDENGKLQKVS